MPASHLAMTALLLLLGARALAEDAAPRAETAAPTWYAQALSRGAAGLNVTHFWSKGAMLRSETVVAAHKIVTIVRGDRYYAYDGLTGKGVSIRREPAAIARDRERPRPFANEYAILVAQGAEQIREEQLLGRRAGVFRVTDEVGMRELWVTLDSARIPLRLEIFDRKTATRRYTDYVNWQSDLPIPDGFFEPDPKAELEEMDHTEYLRRSIDEGTVGPVPVLYTDLLLTKRKE